MCVCVCVYVWCVGPSKAYSMLPYLSMPSGCRVNSSDSTTMGGRLQSATTAQHSMAQTKVTLAHVLTHYDGHTRCAVCYTCSVVAHKVETHPPPPHPQNTYPYLLTQLRAGR